MNSFISQRKRIKKALHFCAELWVIPLDFKEIAVGFQCAVHIVGQDAVGQNLT